MMYWLHVIPFMSVGQMCSAGEEVSSGRRLVGRQAAVLHSNYAGMWSRPTRQQDSFERGQWLCIEYEVSYWEGSIDDPRSEWTGPRIARGRQTGWSAFSPRWLLQGSCLSSRGAHRMKEQHRCG